MISRILILIPLIFLFFPAFCIYLAGKPFVLYYLTAILCIGLYLIINYKFILNKLRILYKYTPFKYFINFAIWCIISGVILVVLGKYSINVFLYYVFSLLIVCYGITYIIPFLTYRKMFNIKFFAKLLLSIYFLIFLVGILEFIGKTYGIDILVTPSDILGNQRLVTTTYISESARCIDRVRSVFAEPGWLGGFIFINAPILYSLTLSKYKIFDNQWINLIIKRSLIPMMWITIFIAQSAIWLVFNLILSIFYFRKNIIRILLKYYKIIIILFFILIIILTSMLCFNNILTIDIGYYKRIINFLLNIYSFEKIVMSDQSLGCRLVSYVITIKIGLKNWFLGIGLGNLGYVFAKHYALSNLPYVGELQSKFVQYLSESNKMNYNGAIPYQFFAETGIVGLSLFYLFVYKIIIYTKKIKIYYCNLESDFINGLHFSLISIAIIIFYDITEAYYYIWFIFGLANIFILNYHQQRKGLKI